METNVKTLLLEVSIVLVMAWSRVHSDTCTKTTSCSCIYSDGSTIDLSPLDSGGGTKPKFLDVQEVLGRDLFSWNPCSPFSEGYCSNVAVCQKSSTVPLSVYHSLGDQSSAVFMNDNKGVLTLSYSAVEGGVRSLKRNTEDLPPELQELASSYFARTKMKSREEICIQNGIGFIIIGPRTSPCHATIFYYSTSYITLTCDQQIDGDFVVQGEKQQSTQFYMILKSKYACPKTSHNGGGNEKKCDLSVGSLICIVFFCLVVVYLAGGIMFQIFVRKESGGKVIPNISFWSKIPGLAKIPIPMVLT